MAKLVCLFAVLCFAVGAYAQAAPAPAGTAVDGVWSVNLNGNAVSMHCVGINDYAQVENIDGVPDISGGTIPVNPSGGTQGKLHCKYNTGIMQFAIQGGSVQLNGRWYSGGWSQCYDASRRTCFVGGIQLSRNSASTAETWNGSWNCDDDGDPNTTGAVMTASMTFQGPLTSTAFLSSEQQEECAVVKHQKKFDEKDPNAGPTFRDQWDFKDVLLDGENTSTQKGGGAWDICIATVDNVAGRQYNSSFSAVTGSESYYETGLIHFTATDQQLLSNFKVGSGCFQNCNNGGTGQSLLIVLQNDDMLNMFLNTGDTGDFVEDLYDSTGQIPDQCGRLAALNSNPNTQCPPDEDAGTNVDGTWTSSSTSSPAPTDGPASSSFTLACQGTNDYVLVENLNGQPPVIAGGVINANAPTVGKLHCRYPGGIVQFVIQDDSNTLHGRWYEGGWDECYIPSERTCYAGMIKVTRNVNTDNVFSGTYWCDDDQEASTQNAIVWDISITHVSDDIVDQNGDIIPFFQRPPVVAQVKRPKRFVASDPNQGPTFRDQWDSLDSTASNREGSWDICIDTVDFDDPNRSYKSSFDGTAADSSSYYETGYIHYTATDQQILSNFKVGSGCYRLCENGGEGTSLIVLPKR
jgi:hypothetical protein